jgi:hypothetical protein
MHACVAVPSGATPRRRCQAAARRAPQLT